MLSPKSPKPHIPHRTAGFVAAIAAIFAAFCIDARSGAAWSYRSTTLDNILLYSDEAVFATVAKFEDRGSGVVEIEFDDVVRSFGRLNLARHASYSVRGELDATRTELRFSDQHTLLRRGRRYLFLLKGGSYTIAPFVSLAPSVFEVVGARVLCAGGEIYGLTPVGLYCSTQTQQAAPPLSENALRQMLEAEVANARGRRPELSREYDSALRPMTLNPNQIGSR